MASGRIKPSNLGVGVDSVYRNQKSYEAQLNLLGCYANEMQAELLRLKSQSPIDSYSRRRGAMVVDAICSRQRKYEARVLPIVAKWESANRNSSLLELAENQIEERELGLRLGEAATLQNVASGLLEYGRFHNISNEDELAVDWARSVESVRYVHQADPFVGRIKGVGPALFAYLRILCGIDAIKPDLRVRKKLESFGFNLPESDIALMHMCEVYAEDLQISRRDFDMLLWSEFETKWSGAPDRGEGLLVLLPDATDWKSVESLSRE